MDGSAPLPSDLVKINDEMRMVEMVFTGKFGNETQELNGHYPIQPSGLVRFSIKVPKVFTTIDMTVSVDVTIRVVIKKGILSTLQYFACEHDSV